MEVSRPKDMLLVVVFLESLSAGIVAPVLSPHIMEYGGTHVHTGLIGAAALFCHQLASQVVNTNFEQKYRRKKALLIHLIIAIMTYAFLIMFTNVWMILLCVCIFSLTNRVEVSCKKFIVEVCQSLSPNDLSMLVDIATISGTVYGAIISGYLYSFTDDIVYNAIVAMGLTAVNIGCLSLIEEDCDGDADPSSLDSIKENCIQKWNNLKKFNYKLHWDIIMLTVAYTGCMTIFFLKFPSLVKVKYKVGVIVAGYTIAHHNMLIFASKCLVPYVQENYAEYWSKIVFEECLVFCSVLLMGLLYAPYYECYLSLFIPMILMRTIVDTMWKTSISDLASDNELQDVCSSLNTIIGIVSPLVFGILAHILRLRISFLILNLLPIAVGVYFVNRRYFKLKQD